MEINDNRWDLILKPKALEDRAFFKKSGNIPLMKKIQSLLEELELHPETGTGKPEKLKENLSGYWSRRINSMHRIVYVIDAEASLVQLRQQRKKLNRSILFQNYFAISNFILTFVALNSN